MGQAKAQQHLKAPAVTDPMSASGSTDDRVPPVKLEYGGENAVHSTAPSKTSEAVEGSVVKPEPETKDHDMAVTAGSGTDAVPGGTNLAAASSKRAHATAVATSSAATSESANVEPAAGAVCTSMEPIGKKKRARFK